MTIAESRRIVAVYAADKGIVGHLRYGLGMLSGEHCGLCTITHSGIVEKGAWRECSAAFELPIDVKYRNELTEAEQQAADGEFPCVLVVVGGGARKVLGRVPVDTCEGDPAALVEAIRVALR